MFISKKILSKKLLALIILGLVLMPIYRANAIGFQETEDSTLAVLGAVLYFLLGAGIKILTTLAIIIDIGLSIDVLGANSTPIIKNASDMVRNMANMLFIIGLILGAFGTIFSILKYDFRKLILRIIIIALIINFSFTISDTIIDFSQSLANVFIGTIGSASNMLGGQLNPEILLGSPDTRTTFTAQITSKLREWNTKFNPNTFNAGLINAGLFYIDGITWIEITQMLFGVIMLSILAFGFLVAAVMIVVRVPILWALIIIAPMAWTLSIFPGTANTNRWWWKQFIGWNLFLPIYLLVFYLGLYLLTKQDEIIKDLAGPKNVATFSAFGFTFQRIFFYCLTSLALIKGADYAMKASVVAGAGGVAAAIWAKGVSWARLGRALPYRGARSGWQATGIPGAYKDTKEHIQKEGFAGTPLEKMRIIGGYRGKRGLEERQAWIAGKLGVPGVADEQLQRNIQGAEERFKKQRYDQKQLDNILSTSQKPEERIAAAKVLKEQYRDLSGDEIVDLYDQYGGAKSPLAAKFLREQNYEKFSREELGKIELGIADPNLHQRIAQAKARRNMFKDAKEFERYLGLFTRDSDRAEFIRNSKELRDTLGKNEAQSIFAGLKDKESKREFATMMLEKGQFDYAQLEQVFDNTAGNTTGIYDSDPERERMLDVAKKSTLLDALKIKREFNILRDLNTKSIISSANPDADIDTVLRQELDKMDVDAIMSQKFSTTAPGGPTGLADPRLLSVLESSLANSRPERVSQFYRNNKYTSNLPLQGIIEPTLDAARLTTLDKEKIKPLVALLLELTTKLIPEIEKQKTAGNKAGQNAAAQTAKFSIDRANDLVKDITSSPIAPQKIKDDAVNNLTPIILRYNNAKK